MKVEKQGSDECVLATIAALADRPLAEIRQLACKVAGVKVWAHAVQTPSYWRAIKYLCNRFGGNLKYHFTSYKYGDPPPGASVEVLSNDIIDLPEKGKGTVIIWRTKGKRISHIMPWSNGKVCDPANPSNWYSLREIKAIFKNWKVNYITSEES